MAPESIEETADTKSPEAFHWSAVWGVLGVLGILSQAIYRLSPRAVEALKSDLSSVQWVILVGWLLFMGYSEGYKGFHKAFSPRVAKRAFFAQRRGLATQIFAPLFCMGFFDATKKRKIVSYVLTFGIITMVLIVRQLPMPWRGIIDVGVVFGLIVGALSVAGFWLKAATRGLPTVDPEVKPAG